MLEARVRLPVHARDVFLFLTDRITPLCGVKDKYLFQRKIKTITTINEIGTESSHQSTLPSDAT